MSNRKSLLFCLQAFNDQQGKPEGLVQFSDYAEGLSSYEFGVIIRAMTLIKVRIKIFKLCMYSIQSYLNV